MPLILEGSFAHQHNTNATSIGSEDQFGVYILALPLYWGYEFGNSFKFSGLSFSLFLVKWY